MIIDFSFGNFGSFKNSTTLSMVATHIKSQDKIVDENNIISVSSNLQLLTSAAIYGANASGKSNIIDAFYFMREMVLESSRESNAGDPISVNPFRLSITTENSPSYFEINCLIKDTKYRYGFEVTRQSVNREWLYFTPSTREVELFTREYQEIKVNSRKFQEGKGLDTKTRTNALFLSVVAQFNGSISLNLQKWFENLRFVSGLNDVGYRGFTIDSFIKDENIRDEILKLVRALDINVDNVQIEKIEESKVMFPKDMPDEVKSIILNSPGEFVSIHTLHNKYDELGNIVDSVIFNLDTEESEGTQKLFSLTGPLVDVLKNGRILLIDEMEARMHPLITCEIIKLFNSRSTNSKHAQLIFTTHDTNLLDKSMFRRDQIWFTEKDKLEASHLYSLVEFKPRNDASFEKNYLQGKYGAIPFLNNLQHLFEEDNQHFQVNNDEQ